MITIIRIEKIYFFESELYCYTKQQFNLKINA